ncbi:DUF6069 family protein [Arthrobacter sp. NPDC090010]|uniref:DUF6069 family protein n=1 Tax=Arthrobacter sp. NPDC090010 TaxID=3363942 RepID=UPI00382C3A30
MNTAFKSYALKGLPLENRIVMAPMTRSRAAEPGQLPSPSMAEYYAQRAGAGLIITEGTQPSLEGQGYTNTPGLHSAEQIAGWRTVTDAVHDAGGRIFVQLMHTGRIGHPSISPDGSTPFGPSAIRAKGQVFTHQGLQDLVVPREMTEEDIQRTIEDFASAARNAVEAGFDGVEIHGANGYLLHQFLSVNANQREDAWGGSVENRLRFTLRVTEAVSQAIGPERTGIRLSPGASFNDIEDDPELFQTYLPLVEQLGELGLAYLHLIEQAGRQLTVQLRDAWPGTFILNPDTGAETPTDHRALKLINDGTADLISFGALFLANPDLPERLASNGPYNSPARESFFGGDDRGYLDYPRLENQAEEAPMTAATVMEQPAAPLGPSTQEASRPATETPSLWRRILLAGAASAVVNTALYALAVLIGASMVMATPQPNRIPWFAPAVASLIPLLIAGLIAWIVVRKRPGASRWFAWGGLLFAVLSCASLLSAPDPATGLGLAAMHLVTGVAWFLALKGARKTAS